MRIEGQIQAHPYTRDNRYPLVYSELARLLRRVPSPRILVFGSSTGEECVALKRYVRGAIVVGCEVQEDLRRRAIVTPGVTTVAPAELEGTFDCICCHSVLCHYPKTWNRVRNDLWSFEGFVETVKEIDTFLRPHGWLSIINAEYQFSDTPTVRRYRASGVKTPPMVTVFDKHGAAINPGRQVVLWHKKF